MSLSQLNKREVTYKALRERAERARELRNESIRAELLAGKTPQQISEATGLSHGRISQIARRRSQ